MTLEALENGIARLIIKRRAANSEEQIEINQKLSKLYDLKILMLEQRENYENLCRWNAQELWRVSAT